MGNISLLGNQKVAYSFDYNPEILETFINKHQENDYFVKFNAPEFTSLCPITGQPDFATIIDSLKPVLLLSDAGFSFFLQSFIDKC